MPTSPTMKMRLPWLAGMGLLTFGLTSALPAQTPPLPENLTETESGLKYVITRNGTGPAAQPGQIVIVHYVGTFMDGSLLDSSRQRGAPYVFTLGMGKVIRGWDEGFALLRVGDQATLIVPPDLAYGPQRRGKIPANSTLRFDVELLDVKDYALGEVLLEYVENRGVEAAEKLFTELKAEKFKGIYVEQSQLRGLGFSLLSQQKFAGAIAFFRWNTELFPQSSGAHENLGEAYAKNGQRDLAMASFEKAIARDSKNVSAAKELADLKAAK
jgi:G:T/U-mismatch repair DNA glycosylase